VIHVAETKLFLSFLPTAVIVTIAEQAGSLRMVETTEGLEPVMKRGIKTETLQ
jgi:hypothetical protein